jgi:hypothetical protein
MIATYETEVMIATYETEVMIATFDIQDKYHCSPFSISKLWFVGESK